MHPGLLPLLPRGMQFRGRQFRVLKDRHVYDQASIATTDTTQAFFQTTSSKQKSQANFQGDQSLVKEANLFLTLQLQALIRDIEVSHDDWQDFFQKGDFVFKVTVPETVTVDRDRLSAIAPGPDAERFDTTNDQDAAVDYGREYACRRTYLVGENKIVPGGRAIEFDTNWLEAAGNGLTAAADLSIVFAGGEYEPGNPR